LADGDGNIRLQYDGTDWAFSSDVNINNVTVGRGIGTATANTIVGVSNLVANTSGANVTAIGYEALKANSTGVGNTATGSQALFTTSTGGYNTAIGYQAGYDNGVGTSNTYIGYNTGRGIGTGVNNTIIGANVTGLTTALAGNIILANGAGNIKAQNDGTNWTLTGNIKIGSYGAGTLTTDAAGNITASSDERLKDINGNYNKGLTELLNINPIVYHWNKLSGNDTIQTYAGFSAQNIKESIPEAVGTDPRGYLTLSDRPILAATVNAIKEQQKTITGQQLAIEKMETEIMKLKKMVLSLKK
jgi:hypothetical protein